MEALFSFQTNYDRDTFIAMSRALRRTVRKKHSKRSHIFGWAVVILGIAATILGGVKVLTIAAVAVIIAALIFEDRLNAYIAMKRMLPGMEKAKSDFCEDRYVSVTEIGTTEWHYDRIKAVAEDQNFFIFLFSKSHSQAYDKRCISAGTADDFRVFIERKTDLTVQRI